MQNDKGEIVDLYVPRKCDATGRIIKANDYSSIQLKIANVNAEGVATGDSEIVALSGFVRGNGESDDSLNRIATDRGYLRNVWSARV